MFTTHCKKFTHHLLLEVHLHKLFLHVWILNMLEINMHLEIYIKLHKFPCSCAALGQA